MEPPLWASVGIHCWKGDAELDRLLIRRVSKNNAGVDDGVSGKLRKRLRCDEALAHRGRDVRGVMGEIGGGVREKGSRAGGRFGPGKMKELCRESRLCSKVGSGPLQESGRAPDVLDFSEDAIL
ncbi:UNVERIFIED_CONTAM: hypothetical protein K2H54_008319 [Gekko kuhli]